MLGPELIEYVGGPPLGLLFQRGLSPFKLWAGS